GQRDVADVEVEGVAVQQQEEHRDEQQDHQRAAIPRDLPELLHGNGKCLHDGPAFSAMSRNTSSSDGSTIRHVAVMPAAASSAVTASGRASGERITACTAVPKMLVFSTAGIASRRRIASTGWSARTSRIG